jgi:hypothetical protein
VAVNPHILLLATGLIAQSFAQDRTFRRSAQPQEPVLKKEKLLNELLDLLPQPRGRKKLFGPNDRLVLQIKAANG